MNMIESKLRQLIKKSLIEEKEDDKDLLFEFEPESEETEWDNPDEDSEEENVIAETALRHLIRKSLMKELFWLTMR